MREAPARRATRRREIVRLSRLTSLDRALVLILVPIWVVCFALTGARRRETGARRCCPGRCGELPDRNGGGHFAARHSFDTSGLRPGDRLFDAEEDFWSVQVPSRR